MDKRSIDTKLKDNLLLRMVVMPYKVYAYKKMRHEYGRSEEPEKIKKFKDCNVGKRCFLIGNGPSLKAEDLDCLKNEITMAANRIWNVFGMTVWRPTYYFLVDPRGEEMLPIIKEQELSNVFLCYQLKKKGNNNSKFYYLMQDGYKVFIHNDRSAHISEDISQYFSQGGTVLFAALQFAIYTGIKEIYLLGVDFNYSHIIDKWGKVRKVNGVVDYFDGKSYSGSRLSYYSVLYAWQAAKKYCDEHGIRIYNATRGGKLEVFERVDFDSLF